MLLQHQLLGTATIAATAAATVPRIGSVPPPCLWLPVLPALPARGVDAKYALAIGNAGTATMGVGVIAEALSARLPALA